MSLVRNTLVVALLSVALLSIADDRVLHIGNTAEPGTLDPHRYFSNAEEHILKDLFLGLTTMGPGGEILPGTALSWSVSESGLTWDFELDRGAKWSNGKPLTADDFVFGFRRQQDPQTASPLAHFLYCLKNAEAINSGAMPKESLGVYAIGPATLRIELERPFPFLLERLLYPIAYPIPEHVVKAHGNDWVKRENWVSNGAYVLGRWNPQEYVELVKNPLFRSADKVAIEKVRYYPLSEPATAYNRYLAGDMNIIHGYPRNLIDTVIADRPDEVRNVPLQSIMYLVFNVQKPPFDDARIREALALAIDKTKITSKLLGVGEIPSSTISPPTVDGFLNDAIDAAPDANKAQHLLTEAGFNADNPLEITLRYISGEENKRVHIAIASMWQEIDVKTTLHHTNLATHFSDLQSGEFQVAQAGWFGENNPEHYIELLWSKIGPANYGRYASAAFDEIFENARNTANLDRRLELLAQAERVAIREYPIVPLYVTVTLNLINVDVSGWEPNGRNLHPARYLSWKP